MVLERNGGLRAGGLMIEDKTREQETFREKVEPYRVKRASMVSQDSIVAGKCLQDPEEKGRHE